MKKILLLLGITAVAATSCKKNYECSCQYETTWFYEGRVIDVSESQQNISCGNTIKIDAKKFCDQLSGTTKWGDMEDGQSTTTTCKLEK